MFGSDKKPNDILQDEFKKTAFVEPGEQNFTSWNIGNYIWNGNVVAIEVTQQKELR